MVMRLGIGSNKSEMSGREQRRIIERRKDRKRDMGLLHVPEEAHAHAYARLSP